MTTTTKTTLGYADLHPDPTRRAVDRTNLPGCLKACEDALCLFFAADDGDPRWDVTYAQLPGGPAGVAVRIEREGVPA